MVYKQGIYRIVKEQDGYRWQDTVGNWKAYDDEGRMTACGNTQQASWKNSCTRDGKN